MAETNSFFPNWRRTALILAYALAAVLFVWKCAQFYQPGKGFTALVKFGDKESARYLPELKALNFYEETDSSGYDAQWYAQLAMHPCLGDAVLRDAIDSVPYRARRILFCWTAYVLALGDPARALQIYAVQNIVCWLALAVLLLRWFPANNWGNFVRWAGVMFSFGLCFSVRGSLVDGPSLLMIAAGVALVEAGRPWWSAALLGIAGLGKETNVLAGAVLLERERGPGNSAGRVLSWRTMGRLVLVVLPLALWLIVLQRWVGESMNAGYRNLTLPFVQFWAKGRATLAPILHGNADFYAWGSVAVLVALTTQFIFLVGRPRWRDPWWRVGAAYAVLMVFLGEAVWEGYPGAAARVLLPMAIAFNVLVPRGRAIGWWIVLLLGNLTIVLAPDTFEPPAREVFNVRGPHELRYVGDTTAALDMTFDASWYGPEQSRFEAWRWSRGDATIALHNPQSFAIVADLAFRLRVRSERSVIVSTNGRELWRGALKPSVTQSVALRDLVIPPGGLVLRFETDQPARQPDAADRRTVAFSIRNVQIQLKRRME